MYVQYLFINVFVILFVIFKGCHSYVVSMLMHRTRVKWFTSLCNRVLL